MQRDDIPEDFKKLTLALLTDADLEKVLARPGVAEARKVEVRAEIERRRTKEKT